MTRNSLVAWRIQTPTATYGTTFRPKRSARSWNRLPPHCCCTWSAPVHHQHRVAHGPAVLVRGASPVRRVGQASSRRADRDTGTRWPPSMGSGKPTTGRPVCGARRRPPYRTRMTRDMGTCRNALRITWFGQRHLTSTLRPIIAQLKIVLFGGSEAQLIVGCESRKRVLRPVLRPG